MVKRVFAALCICILLCLSNSAVQAKGAVPRSQYAPEGLPELPEEFPVNIPVETGSLSIQLTGSPVLTKTTNHIVSEGDTKFLVIKVAITNTSSQTLGWLSPKSFVVQDTYLGRIYGTWRMNIPASLKAAGVSLPPFFAEIKSGETINTTIVFSVYPEAESWIFTFSPQTYYGGSFGDPVRYSLPRPIDMN